MTQIASQLSIVLSRLKEVVGDRYVVDRTEDLLVYEYDGSIDRHLPAAVVIPGSAQEIARCVAICSEAGVPIVPRGSGTGLSGGAVPTEGTIQVVTSRLRKILEVDTENRVAIVEPGVINADLSAAIEHLGLHYVPDPSSQRACSIGGNVAENAGGPHCLAYGVTTNHVLGMEVVLANGEMIWLGGEQRETPGYDLRGAFIGSEGTLGIATKIAVRLIPIPEAIRTVAAVFNSMDMASKTVSDIIGAGVIPAALEMMDRVTIDAVEPTYHPGYPAEAKAVLIIEVDGLRETVEEQSEQIEAICRQNRVASYEASDDAARRAELWAARKGAIGAFGNLRPNYYLVDGVVPRTKLQEVLAKVAEIGAEFDLTIANVFHAGDGNLHPSILFDERIPGETEKVIEAGGRILKLCVEVGGALSGEHGIGLEKQAYMPLVFNEDDMRSMGRLAPAFGATGHFNPSKVFPADNGDGPAFSKARRSGTHDVV
ncbi:MAG: FAD-binding protein [Chloroflexi bacterium]|nr:FAD-binding protein [Chloroflexota bacterium]